MKRLILVSCLLFAVAGSVKAIDCPLWPYGWGFNNLNDCIEASNNCADCIDEVEAACGVKYWGCMSWHFEDYESCVQGVYDAASENFRCFTVMPLEGVNADLVALGINEDVIRGIIEVLN